MTNEASSRTAILDALSQVLRTEFEIDETRPEAHLVDDLDLDSLDVVSLCQGIEDTTGVALDAEDFRTTATLGDVVSLVCERLGP